MAEEIKQNEIQEIRKKIEDLSNIITEKQKNDELVELKKELQSIKQNVQNILHSSGNNQQQSMIERQEIIKWLRDIVNLPEYIELFIQNGIENLEILREVTMDDLNQMGIKKCGHRIKIMKAIEKLRGTLPIQAISNQIGNQLQQNPNILPIAQQVAAPLLEQIANRNQQNNGQQNQSQLTNQNGTSVQRMNQRNNNNTTNRPPASFIARICTTLCSQ